jgi:hypothetical protein
MFGYEDELHEEIHKLRQENAYLTSKLEDVQATAYADSVDAGMRERSLRRALWLLRSAFAARETDLLEEQNKPKTCWWADFANKCRAKAEEYK